MIVELTPSKIIYKGKEQILGEIWMTYKKNPRYKVSNLGGVKGWHGGHKRWNHKKTRKDKDGYETINVTNPDGSETTARVHRMVAETFIPNPTNCPVVNHKDNIKDNNDASNLEWVTISYNTKHGYYIGASISAASKFIKVTYPDGKLYSYYQSCARMAKGFKIGRGRAEKDVLKGNFLGILNLEIVDKIPENTITDRIAFDVKIPFQYINPYKINYNNGNIEYFENVKAFAIQYKLTQSQAQRVLCEQLPHLLERYNIKSATKISKQEYCKLYIKL